jgi:multisite-specific tRNA:(cytosine-C5)-methyltransferase
VSDTYIHFLTVLGNCVSENIRVNSSFPSHNLFVRNAQSRTLRAIYLSNSLVKSVITANEPSRLRFISAGIKIIGRQDSGQSGKAQANQRFRVLNDGVSSVLPYLRDEDILKADLTALKMFLQQAYPVVRGFAEPFKSTLENRRRFSLY